MAVLLYDQCTYAQMRSVMLYAILITENRLGIWNVDATMTSDMNHTLYFTQKAQ